MHLSWIPKEYTYVNIILTQIFKLIINCLSNCTHNTSFSFRVYPFFHYYIMYWCCYYYGYFNKGNFVSSLSLLLVPTTFFLPLPIVHCLQVGSSSYSKTVTIRGWNVFMLIYYYIIGNYVRVYFLTDGGFFIFNFFTWKWKFRRW